ncbi:MAG: outer membrane beta-barrel protein [Spirosoma sp.]|nr:outer membrane beta-barrel protein [Spirosoma sp.]
MKNVMKRQLSVLALCLSGIALAQAQTSTMSPASGTLTTGTYTTTPATTSNTDNSMNATTPSKSYNNGSTTTDSSANVNSGTMGNSRTTITSGTYNSAAPAYGTTTTTYSSTDTKVDRSYEDPSSKKGRFGVYAGANFSRFVNEPIPDGAYRAGYQIGVYGRTAGTIFGQLGVEYRTSTAGLVRNGAGQPTQTPRQISGNIDQHFIAIPAYVGARLGTALGVRLQVGAELSALVVNSSNEFGIGNDDVRRAIVSGLAGVGINLGPVTVDAVYNLGLTNVFEANDTKRRLIAINLGFRF